MPPATKETLRKLKRGLGDVEHGVFAAGVDVGAIADLILDLDPSLDDGRVRLRPGTLEVIRRAAEAAGENLRRLAGDLGALRRGENG